MGFPIIKDRNEESLPEAIYQGSGIAIKSAAPVMVYVLVRFMASSGAFLALPVSSLGTKYIVSSYGVDPMLREDWGAHYPSISCITSVYDNTKVKFTLGGNSKTETGGGMLPGEEKTATLNKGDVWMFMSKNDESDLSGSVVSSDKPVAVVSGNYCAMIPFGNKYAGYIVEADLPVDCWGKKYLVPFVPIRKNPGIVRIYASEDSTNVFLDGNHIGFLTTGGGLINEGYIETRVCKKTEEYPNHPAIITADKPIGVSLYNTGCMEDSYPLPDSDPFQMNIYPIENLQKELNIFQPGIDHRAGYDQNYISLIYESDSLGNASENIELIDIMDEYGNWQNIQNNQIIGTKFNKQFADSTDGKNYMLKTLFLPATGFYKIKSQAPFAAYSFGFDWCDSYGFPSAAGTKFLNIADSASPVPEYSFDENTATFSGTITDFPEDEGQRSNMAGIMMIPDSSYNFNFTCGDFMPGLDRAVSWTLEQTDTSENSRGLIYFFDKTGNDTLVDINVFKRLVKINPGEIEFEETKTGEENEKKIKIRNVCFQDVTINEITLKYDDNNFQIENTISDEILESQNEIELTVKFQSDSPGYYQDEIIVSYDENRSESADLSILVKNSSAVTESCQFALNEIHPNPAGPEGANIDYSIGAYSDVKIELFSLDGTIVSTLVSSPQQPGNYSVRLPIEKLNSGMYICRMSAGSFEKTINIRVVK